MSGTTSARADRLAAIAVRWRYFIVLAALVVTAAAAGPAIDLVRLHIRTNIFALLPPSQPSVRSLDAVIRKAGGWGDLVVLVDSPDPEADIRFADRVQAALAGAPWVNYSEYRADQAFLESHALLLIAKTDLETIAEQLDERYRYEVAKRDPFFVSLFEDEPPSLDFSALRRSIARAKRSAPCTRRQAAEPWRS